MKYNGQNSVGFSPAAQTLEGQLLQEILQMSLPELSAYLDKETPK